MGSSGSMACLLCPSAKLPAASPNCLRTRDVIGVYAGLAWARSGSKGWCAPDDKRAADQCVAVD